MSRPYLLLLAAVLALITSGCGSDSVDTTPPVAQPPVDPYPPSSRKIDPSLVEPGKFASCEAYDAYVADSLFQRLTRSWCFSDFCLDTAQADGVTVTQTNTQEPGVDEADAAEVDSAGNIYSVTFTGKLLVTQGLPVEEAAPLAELQLPEQPRELLLDEANQLLVVLSETTDVYSFDPSQSFGWTVSIVDIANPANPLLLGTLNLEGSLFAARRIGSRVHMFSRKSLVVPGSFYEDGGTELLNQYFEAVNNEDETLIGFYEDALRTFIADIVSTNSSTFRPTYSELNGAQQVVACDNIDAPVVPVEYGITSILSFDTDGSDVDIAAVVSNAFGAYVSTGNAYLVQSSYGWFWDPAQADETAIYKYQLGDGVATYQALATVPGQVVNNLAMSEHDDVLRIATTEIAYDNSEAPRFYQTNHLHTLADNGQGQLEVLGAILDFELDENIRSARFVGDVGYVVTFRQIDPLFTFDLSDPANPQLMGALELPGFSTYIHPVGESHLLTLGFADVIDNNVTAMALRIFDVSDLSAPRLDHTYVIDPEDEAFNNGWSSALYDHRAFTYDDGLLALPLKSWSADNPFTGFAFFGIDLDAGITDLGRLSHNDVIQQSVSAWRCETFGDCDATQSVISGAPSRTIFVTTPAGRYIHSVSEGGLKITPANDPVQVLNTVVFDL